LGAIRLEATTIALRRQGSSPDTARATAQYDGCMKFPRSCGVLLHPTSLPGRFGIGDLGHEARQFADLLAAAGQTIWQVLPLSPTGYGDSPYQSYSAFAGNALLISPDKLVEDGFLEPADIAAVPGFPDDEVDFQRVIHYKFGLLRKAYQRFTHHDDRREFEEFCDRERAWLDDFARFAALKEANGGVAWTDWTHPDADPAEIEAHKFWQFEFFRQWDDLKRYCGERKIRVMGDVPIYVAHDSADVWANPGLFELDANGRPTKVAGVPPDYFSATGQLWGNPIYRWDKLAETGYKWWIDRLRATLRVVDMLRLDHFRGFEAYWEVPGGEQTAVNGEWVKGPGAKFFETIQKELGELPLVAENLGVITPEVEALRERFGFPGMSILQFAFGADPEASKFRPHNFPHELVAYTGTHDNDTTVGWWNSQAGTGSTRSAAEIERERAFVKAYLNTDGHDIHWAFIRALMASPASTVMVPLQDVLGLGNEARMNLPASTKGNWRWRFRSGAITPDMIDRLKLFTVLYDR
jgi:4-alpha-glucanotransferase